MTYILISKLSMLPELGNIYLLDIKILKRWQYHFSEAQRLYNLQLSKIKV